MNSKTCCIFNLAPHYRLPIYSLMDRELVCDFYFGDNLNNNIKLIDYNNLKGFKKELKNKTLPLFGFMWQTGAWQLIFKPYKNYIITGSPSILSNWLLLLLAKLSGKKVYAWTHGLKKPVVTNGDLFQKTFYKLCHKVLLYGDYSKKVMLSEGFKASKLIPIYNSLDYKLQLEVRGHLEKSLIFENYFKNSYPTLIYVGRIQKVKKLDLLIKAVYELKKEQIPCNVVVVGSDVEDNNLQSLVNSLKMEKQVWFYGPCYDEKVLANMFFNANVCVSPGPIGLTALHSLTYGCPVISNDDFEKQMPEHEAITVGVNGDFFKNDDLTSLTEKLKYWAYLNAEEREKARTASYHLIDSRWNPDAQIKTLKKTLN